LENQLAAHTNEGGLMTQITGRFSRPRQLLYIAHAAHVLPKLELRTTGDILLILVLSAILKSPMIQSHPNSAIRVSLNISFGYIVAVDAEK
jgi:hypothetical protein